MICPWCLSPYPLQNEIYDLCFLFHWAAGKTWFDLRESQRLGIGISEDSITDMLLLEMGRRTNRLACKRYSRTEESNSGADWLWWFVSGDKGFPILIQAKRLYPSGRYEALKSQPSNQTDALLKSASNKGWLPLFCFYNYWPSTLNSPSWGCTVALANSIMGLLSSNCPKPNHIDKIGPESVPWTHLVCPSSFSPSQENFPESIRSRVMDIFGIETFPEVVHPLPDYVMRILRMASDEDHRELPGELDFLNGIVVVSNHPFERQNR